MSESVTEQSTDTIEVNEGNENLNKTQDEEAEEEGQKEKLVQLPLSRVKNIAKVDPDVNLINADATFLIAKSTELFIESIVREAYKSTAQSKRKTVQKVDIDNAVESVDSLMFLEEMLN